MAAGRIDEVTLAALRAFPDQLADHFAAIAPAWRHWAPPSWEGVPSEAFTAIEQVWHVRDIEVEGYHLRIRRTLEEDTPLLASIDSEAVAAQRNYGLADAQTALADFRQARATTLALVATLEPVQLKRTAIFEGYGPLTLRSLVHYLCSHDQQHLAGLQWLRGKIAAHAAA
ncbi:DinB family protein [uncultured Ramlibacter sp.]|uniref:DinB family protein n=1 Tax=uncultured Ramlibacter sp. TaxID=260755 RepID=UPI0026122610|nr:DinB family protein [uncultured Ramlibacter sp.]